MKLSAILLAVVAIPLLAFAWWGTSTVTGRTKYDEMDGLYPQGAGVLGIALILISLALAWFGRHSG